MKYKKDVLVVKCSKRTIRYTVDGKVKQDGDLESLMSIVKTLRWLEKEGLIEPRKIWIESDPLTLMQDVKG